MIHELWYTSAPRGLFAGSRGFCTVKATRNLPPSLLRLLESMSAYQQVIPPHQSDADNNPICVTYSHHLCGTKQWRIVSRMESAGVDHTQRANFIARHFATDQVAEATGLVQLALTNQSRLETGWDGQPKELDPPQVRAMCSVGVESSPDASYEAWAAAIANQLAKESTPVNVLFPVGYDTLALTLACLQRLPAELRAETTFSTFHTKTSGDHSLRLRFVLADSAAAKQIPQTGAASFDLRCPPPIGCEVQDRASPSRRAPVELKPAHGAAASMQQAPSLLANDAAWRARRETPRELFSNQHASTACRTLPQSSTSPNEKIQSHVASPRRAWAAAGYVLGGCLTACFVLVPLLVITTTRQRVAAAKLEKARQHLQNLQQQHASQSKNASQLEERLGRLQGVLNQTDGMLKAARVAEQTANAKHSAAIRRTEEMQQSNRNFELQMQRLLADNERQSRQLQQVQKEVDSQHLKLIEAKQQLADLKPKPKPNLPRDAFQLHSWQQSNATSAHPLSRAPLKLEIIQSPQKLFRTVFNERTKRLEVRPNLPGGRVGRPVAEFACRTNNAKRIEFRWLASNQLQLSDWDRIYDSLLKATLQIHFDPGERPTQVSFMTPHAGRPTNR